MPPARILGEEALTQPLPPEPTTPRPGPRPGQVFPPALVGFLTAGLILLLVFGPPAARAQTTRWVATDCAGVPSPCYTTIQEAVNAAVGGDIIRILPGTYGQVNNLGGTSQVVYVNKPLTLEGADPSNPPTIAPATPARAIFIAGAAVTLRNLKIALGDAAPFGGQGGGLYATGAQLTIEDCEFAANRGNSSGQGQGGGAFIVNSTVALRGAKFVANLGGDGAGDGGGLYLSNSTATIGASARGPTIFQGNRAARSGSGRGGGVFAAGGSLTLGDTEVRANIASEGSTGQGGGLYAEGAGLTLGSGTLFAGNTASQAAGGDGGGAFVSGGQVNIGPAVFQDNVAASGPGRGGGLYLGRVSGSVSGTRFAANLASVAAEGRGGGAYVDGGSVTLTGTAFTGNIGSRVGEAGYGGGLFLTGVGAAVSGGSFTANFAARAGPGYGGGIAAQAAAARLTGIEVRSNTATDAQKATGQGGGIWASGSSLTILQATVAQNTASVWGIGAGGGLAFTAGSDGLVSASKVGGSGVDGNVASAAPDQVGLGGGFWVEASSTKIVGNLVVNNLAASQGGSAGYGGGVYLIHSPAEVRQNSITGNNASPGVGQGGGIYAVDSPALIEANLLQANFAAQGGGFVLTTQSLAGQGLQAFQAAGGIRLLRNRIFSNLATGSGGMTAIGGGGVIDRTSDFKLINNIFAQNTVAGGGNGIALWLAGTSAVPTSGNVYFNTLADHPPPAGTSVPGAVFLSDNARNLNFVDNIWSERPGFEGSYGVVAGGAGVQAALNYTLWNGFSGRRVSGPGITTANDFTGDPKFINPGGLDYHIQADSAAVNKGVDVGVNVDIDGDPRPWGGGFDLGADEFLQVAARLFLPVVRSGAP